jgi:hypothetical protein
LFFVNKNRHLSNRRSKTKAVLKDSMAWDLQWEISCEGEVEDPWYEALHKGGVENPRYKGLPEWEVEDPRYKGLLEGGVEDPWYKGFLKEE